MKKKQGFNRKDARRDACFLVNGFSTCGYDWWWHSFTGRHEKTGEENAFFIEFFLCNPAYGKEGPVFGQLAENQRKGLKPSYLMVKAGAWGEDATQLHRFFGWKKIAVRGKAPFAIHADDCRLSEKATKGHVSLSPEEVRLHPEYMAQAGEMSWDLKIDKQIAFNVGYGAGKLLRSLGAFEMFWHAEGMKTAFSGEVVFNGERYRVSPEDCYGYSDKNWGKDFTSPWVWLSSNNLRSTVSGKKLKNSVFDIGGGCPKVGPVKLKRKLLSAFWYEGVPFEFNFSKFWTFTRTKFRCHETEEKIVWHVDQRTWRNRMVTDICCDKKDMLLIRYEAPNGKMLHKRLWNGGNGRGIVSLYRDGKLIDRIRCENTGCEYGEYEREEK
ncbi:MAG: hypothetical protein K6E50_14655 [Lachnospiraceae bacterium]|nr:hypothetical protein [Lachnospiraceae bacterium]